MTPPNPSSEAREAPLTSKLQLLLDAAAKATVADRLESLMEGKP